MTSNGDAIAVSAGIRAVDKNGRVLVFSVDDVQVLVQVLDETGAVVEEPAIELYDPANMTDPAGKPTPPQPRELDVVLVADNSGSEQGHLELIQLCRRGIDIHVRDTQRTVYVDFVAGCEVDLAAGKGGQLKTRRDKIPLWIFRLKRFQLLFVHGRD